MHFKASLFEVGKQLQRLMLKHKVYILRDLFLFVCFLTKIELNFIYSNECTSKVFPYAS